VDLGSPLADIIPGARGQLLAALTELDAPVTVRALARHAGVAPQTALTVVNELTATGLVQAQRAGQAHLVILNRAHLLAQPLMGLTGARTRLIEMLRDELSGWPGLAAGWLFGPAARGDGDRGSLVDLLLVASTTTETPTWAAATGRLANQVQTWTGNRVQLVEHSRGSFALAIRGGSQLIEAIRTDGLPLTQASQSLLRMSG
jgi:predicted nucleotidyltransferase